MSQIQEDRVIEGIALPEPGEWQLDPVHTSVEFVARHLMVSKVRGRFTNVQGTIHVAENPAESWVEVDIDAANVERYPQITFKSTKVEGESPGHFLVHGDLTVHGVTRAVSLEVEYHGWTPDPLGDR